MLVLTKNGNILTSNGSVLTIAEGGGGGSASLTSLIITPSESSQTFSPTGYDGYNIVTCNAISSTYVGTGISRKSSSDLTVSGKTITAPAGYYTSSASLSVADGTAGTPTASKGTVSNNSISITPSVTNTTGYITGSTKTGTAVTVSASELVSGTKSITANGTNIDVTNYAAVNVSVSGGTINVQNNKTYTVSTSGNQTISPDSGYDAMEAVALTVPALTLPTVTTSSATSGYTSKATISRSTSDQYINIPPGYNSAGGYYKISAVANGSATGPSSLSGTSATVSTGTNTLTLTKTGITTTPTVNAGYVSSATASTATVTLTANVTTKATATYYPSASDQTISANQYLTGTQTIKGVTTTNLIAENIKKNVVIEIGDTNNSDRILNIVGSYEGSGNGSNLQVGTATTTPLSASSSISFTGLSGEPTSFVVTSMSDLATGSSPWKTASVVYDGTNVIGQVITNTSNAQVTYDSSGFSKSYNNGTLTITGTSTNFQANQYKLVYTYGGSSSNIDTVDVQVGSGATSITFTGLSDEPSYFSCIFKSNFSTSSGYQRVITVVYDGTSTYGLAMDSGANADTNWSYTYNNGSLTLSSSGTNAGGYFHQPGYYQLTYATGEVIELTAEPLSVIENGTYTAPKGKAYTPVIVNVSGSKNVQYVMSSASVRTNGYTSTGMSITVAKTGTYKVSWAGWRSSSQGTMGSNLYKNGSAGTNQQTFTNTYGQCITLNNQSYNAGDVLTLYATAGSTSRYMWVANLIIEEQ